MIVYEACYQIGDPGSMLKTSAMTMKAKPVPCAAWNDDSVIKKQIWSFRLGLSILNF